MDIVGIRRGAYERPKLDVIRYAVLHRRVVEFGYRGETILGEPHIFGQAIRTGSFWLKVFDRAAESWRYIPFYQIRDFHCLGTLFDIRPGFCDQERKIVAFDTIARLR